MDSPVLQRWRGSLGAFALDPLTGRAMAILDAASPTGPYILDEPTHRAAVRAYFVGAGIPADQVGDILADYSISGVLPRPALSAPTQLDSINSTLTRVVGGIRVVESYAWAKMTTAGDVDMEDVFWPSLDMNVVNAAIALAATMGNGASHGAFVAKLPGPVYQDIDVVIHHSTPWIRSAPVGYVAYDVILDASSSAAVRHFDASGAEFRLPQELLAPPIT